MSWRLARSLVTLRDEIRALHPGTTVWTVGDAAHRATWSLRANPPAGVRSAVSLQDAGSALTATPGTYVQVVTGVRVSLRAVRLGPVRSPSAALHAARRTAGGTRSPGAVLDPTGFSVGVTVDAVRGAVPLSRRRWGAGNARQRSRRSVYGGGVPAVSPPSVLRKRDSLQVIRTYARADAAKVVDLMPVRDRPDEVLVGPSVRRRLRPAACRPHRERAVAVRASTAHPEPASIGVCANASPESTPFAMRVNHRGQYTRLEVSHCELASG